ncbi:MAG: rhomboid family intramembrane serine protease [Chthoniobacterales bacterium]
MDLNHLFLFVVIVSTLIVLARGFRAPGALPWRRALVVLVITGLAWLVVPGVAGWIAVAGWFVLVILPALISNRAWRQRAGAREQPRLTVAVATLMILNAVMFLVEVVQGGSMNPATLHRLGQLEPASVLYRHEYWRLLAALFLHYGPLHLAFNLYALWIIGPGLERVIGALRFSGCYLLAGIGSSAAVVVLRAYGLTRADELVGASGCVMGIVGAWAGFLLRHRDAPLAGRRLQNIVMIVVIQTAFDLATPQVSMAAHLSGLMIGLIAGLVVA